MKDGCCWLSICCASLQYPAFHAFLMLNGDNILWKLYGKDYKLYKSKDFEANIVKITSLQFR